MLWINVKRNRSAYVHVAAPFARISFLGHVLGHHYCLSPVLSLIGSSHCYLPYVMVLLFASMKTLSQELDNTLPSVNLSVKMPRSKGTYLI